MIANATTLRQTAIMSEPSDIEGIPSEDTVHAWARLVRISTGVLEKVRVALKAEGLPPIGWYDVLLELHRVGQAGLRQFEIGAEVLLTKHNLSRLIDRLERERLVERQSCLEDGRGNVVRITPAGSAMLRRMWPVYRRVLHREIESRLTASELADLSRILAKLAQRDSPA